MTGEAPGEVACARCAAEDARRFRPGSPSGRPLVGTPEVAAEIVAPMMAGMDREQCVTLNLDTRHRLIAVTTVSIGSIDHTFMSPREVFRDALGHNAAAVVLAHNHPSGDPEPSADDKTITRRIAAAGDLLGIPVLDHVVIGEDSWVSLARRGVLDLVDEQDLVAERSVGSYPGPPRVDGERQAVPAALAAPVVPPGRSLGG